MTAVTGLLGHMFGWNSSDRKEDAVLSDKRWRDRLKELQEQEKLPVVGVQWPTKGAGHGE